MVALKKMFLIGFLLASILSSFAYMYCRDKSLLFFNIISYATGDCDNDGKNELIVITKPFFGDLYGDNLLVFHSDVFPIGIYEPKLKFDLSDLKPMQLQLCEINGDGITDIFVLVYKTAEFHQVYSKRPFFYNLKDQNLIPLWRGSRLSRPFEEIAFSDLDSDGVQELIATEYTSENKLAVSAYKWQNFGFERVWETGDSHEKISLMYDNKGPMFEIGTKTYIIELYNKKLNLKEVQK